ncbi:Non-classical phosphatidylinositol transfer protein (PITP) [Spiromyces aspiralis]|uniref:Non-classical phosphatidylinositol transfer protein (PITP) n=1 Tax=Spiromyces aspiralis TaxID=68401 RepID=A0ACC1HX17_9FUNG|nr:Non-classical phosphatidylinositol transfer protein (PITP) [Spiromyces aspiralis]
MSTSVVATPVANKPTEFSDEERAALAELHKRLPEVFESAAKQTTKPVEKAIWGVPLEPSLNDPRTDVVLVKFLRARTLDADAAAKMLADTLQWRSDFEINALLDEEFPEDIFKNIGVVYGKDRRGRPVTYNFYGSPECKEGFKDIERFLRWRIQLMEKGVRQLDFVNVADMVQVHDYDGVGIFSYDRNARTASRETIK